MGRPRDMPAHGPHPRSDATPCWHGEHPIALDGQSAVRPRSYTIAGGCMSRTVSCWRWPARCRAIERVCGRHPFRRRQHDAGEPAGQGLRGRRRPAGASASNSNTPRTSDDANRRRRRSRPAWATCCCRRRSRSSAAAVRDRRRRRLSRDARGVRITRKRTSPLSTGGGVKIGLDRSGAAAAGLPGVQAGRRCAELASAPLLCRTESEVLSVGPGSPPRRLRRSAEASGGVGRRATSRSRSRAPG